jgi:hypothetical protein
MTESLSVPRIPEPEHALRDLLCWLTRDIRLILTHPDLGNAAKLAGITKTLDRLAPPPELEANGARTATLVAELLARNTGPATVLFEELAGEQIRIDLTGRADRPLTEAECRGLQVDPGSYGHLRTGTLRTVRSGLVAADVHSIVVPDGHSASPVRTSRSRRPQESRSGRFWPASACAASRSAHAWSATVQAFPAAGCQ